MFWILFIDLLIIGYLEWLDSWILFNKFWKVVVLEIVFIFVCGIIIFIVNIFLNLNILLSSCCFFVFKFIDFVEVEIINCNFFEVIGVF